MHPSQPNERGDQHAPAPSADRDAAVPIPRETSEAIPAQDPPSAPPAGGGTQIAAGKGFWSLRLAMVLGLSIGLVVCSVGLMIGYYEYGKLAEPDRGSPRVTVEQYVNAAFGDRALSDAAHFACPGAELAEVQAMRDDLNAREKESGIEMTVTTANYLTEVTGTSAKVEVDLRVTTTVSRSSRRWEFSLREDDGWRICAARRIG